MRDRRILTAIFAGLVIAVAVAVGLSAAGASSPSPDATTTTPIKHVVVIFDENISFDHYFGTYPNALNPPGEPAFTAKAGTPSVNGLTTALLTHNPNLANPQRLDRADPVTCDQDHSYSPEQSAFDHGLMDKFVQNTAGGGCSQLTTSSSSYGNNATVMDYYDGNTVTALWNYAQNFALNDNSFDTQFGPSTPGALNLISGDTTNATATGGGNAGGAILNGTVLGDADPANDDCSDSTTMSLSGQNVGNLLNTKGVTWGWFQGGFTPTSTSGTGIATCGATHANIVGANEAEYVPHHEPFQYYTSTSNPHHLPPSSVGAIGTTDQANHQYDLTSFDAALANGNLPAVSFLKGAQYEDAHAGSSDPLDEQQFIVDHVNEIEQSPDWSSTAIIIAYDDSDGWYDHVASTIVRPSGTVADTLDGASMCGTGPYVTVEACGYGPRLPLLVISPWAKQNYVDNTLTDQTSIIRFIEDNWSLGRIGGNSADAVAGTLDNMFDFNTSDPRAPAVVLDQTTGNPPPTVSSMPPTTTTTTTPVLTPKPVPQLRITSTTAAVKAHELPVTLTCLVAACAGKVQLTETVTVRVKVKVKKTVHGHKETVTKTETKHEIRELAVASYSVAVAQVAKVELKLTTLGKTVLAKVAKHHLHETFSATVTGGASVTKPVLIT